MIARINAKVEKALRQGLTSAARIEVDRIEPGLAGLDDTECAEALGLAIIITCYVAAGVCGAERRARSSHRRVLAGR